jgi:hypothetical protein
MMQRRAKLIINQTEIELELSDLTALRDQVIQLAEGVEREADALAQAREIVRDYSSIEEAIAAKEAQVNRLCGLAVHLAVGAFD